MSRAPVFLLAAGVAALLVAWRVLRATPINPVPGGAAPEPHTGAG